MVDFKKLKSAKGQQKIADPVEIFRRLPKPPGINDLYGSQLEVLEAWKKRRTEQDVVIKLHTGGGKTLVGLLIAQSIMNETRGPVVYLTPTVQLVQQTLDKAKEYGIPAVPYEKGTGEFQDEFLSGQSVMICAYEALFSGTSRFGVRGGTNEIISAAAIILDDAHVAFSRVRDSFTIKVTKDKDPDGYAYLSNLFRADFQDVGKGGTFDDIVAGSDMGVLEVPYWSWKNRSGQVSEYLRSKAKDYPYTWPLLRDALDYCHALVTRTAFVVTPILPLVDMIPTFAECPHRVFMSATISDDSDIIRTFDADPQSVAKAISSKSLAGVSERMVLVPALMGLDNVEGIVLQVIDWAANREKVGTVVLVPSDQAAKRWKTVATFAETSAKVGECINDLLDGSTTGPFVFSNRYDGIDLPGQACRLLVLAGLPRGMSEYDQYRAIALSGGTAIHSAIARRVEQGMGRGARGANDYCVVLLTDKDLVAWISRSSNLRLLTSSTRAQVEMGITVSKDVKTARDLAKTIRLCFKRDKDWMEYHASELADLTDDQKDDSAGEFNAAAIERKALQLMRDGYCDKAVARLEKFIAENDKLDAATISWLKQLAARAAEYCDNQDKALELQQAAYAKNKNLLRPKVLKPYEALTIPGKQATSIVAAISEYFPRQGFLAALDEVTAHLVPEASSAQFEQALAEFGSMLGFRTERPDKKGSIGPDVLWLHEELSFILEAKSRKKFKNALNKDDVGQLFQARQWFRERYLGHPDVAASVLPKAVVTSSSSPGDLRALTFTWLNDLVAEARSFFEELCDSAIPTEGLKIRCEKLLKDSTLTPKRLAEHYLSQFTEE